MTRKEKKKIKVIRKIQKLKALAEHTGGDPKEAESAAAMAARLMLAHAISEVELGCAIDEKDDPVVRVKTDTGRGLFWIRSLYHSVALSNNCTTSYVRGSDSFHLYGAQSDCEIAEYLSIYLTRQVDYEIRRYMGDCRRSGQKGDRNGFAHSAVVALGRRLTAMKREAQKEAEAEHGADTVSNALVVMDNKLQAAQDFAKGFGIGKGKKNRYHFNQAGYNAGEGINITKGLSGNAAPAPTQIK